MAGGKKVAAVGRSSMSVSMSDKDPRSRRANQAALATDIELGDSLEMDSKQRLRVAPAKRVAKVDTPGPTPLLRDMIAATNGIIDALKAANLMDR